MSTIEREIRKIFVEFNYPVPDLGLLVFLYLESKELNAIDKESQLAT